MTAPAATEPSFLPDFCRGPAVFGLLLISQLVAVVIVVASPVDQLVLGPRIVVVSLYLHWISLLSASALCFSRAWLSRRPLRISVSLTFCLLLAITLVISEAAFRVGQLLGWPEFTDGTRHGLFLARNGLISAIVIALVLRYFFVLHAWRRQVTASAEARFAALQARIRPHFFFNSLNSVAALIPTRPQQAEELLEDLSDLFRAILKSGEPWTTLAREIELSHTYLRIEELRLGDRLKQHWELPEGADTLRLPLLSLQPLIENAIYHGIEQLPEGGTLRVRISHRERRLRIVVSNPVPEQPRSAHGHRIAHDNIRQRLRLLYDDRASLTTRRHQGEYRAELCVPA